METTRIKYGPYDFRVAYEVTGRSIEVIKITDVDDNDGESELDQVDKDLISDMVDEKHFNNS